MSKTTVASLETRVVALEGMVKHHQSMVESLTRALANQQEIIQSLVIESAKQHIATLKDDRQAAPAVVPNERRRAMLAAREEARRTGKCVAVKFN